MPTNFAQKNKQRAYLVQQADPLVVTNTAGAATVANADACVFTKCTLNGLSAQIVRPDITGSRVSLASVKGRQSGNWSIDMSLAGSGTAGTVPDCDAILVSTFGQAATVVSSTSVTYNLSDSIPSFSLFHFRKPSTVLQRIGAGCVVKETTFSLGPDIATLSSNGECISIIDSYNFTNIPTAGKCGLTSFPTEPSSPTTLGNAVIGFTGAITMDSQTIATLKSATIKIASGNQIIADTFNSFYGTGVIGDIRTVSVSFVIDDSDDAATADLYAKAFSQAAIDMTIQVGLVAGNIWTWTLKNVQLAQPSLEDGQLLFRANFGDSVAHGTSPTALDECKLVVS
jgi:hypothetical protein